MKFFVSLIIFTVITGCCQQKSQTNSIQEQQNSTSKEAIVKEEIKTEEQEKQEKFEQDVNWIYSYTLQHSFNPAKEDQVKPQEKSTGTETNNEDQKKSAELETNH